jgi:putative solute:sodium symporter small subunit
MIDDEQRRLHGKRSLRLAIGAAAAVFLIALILPLFAPSLNGLSLLRFPLGLLLLSHGTVIAIVALIYWAAARQDLLDRRHGLTSEF